MKIITVTLATLLISGLASAHEMTSATSDQDTSHRGYYSGSSTIPAPGNTMNDRDKMLEACRSIRTDKSCDEIIQSCQGQEDRLACVHNYMRK